MKIAINALPFTSWQGIEIFLSHLINYLPARKGDEVVVFANQKSADFLRPVPSHIRLEVKEFKKLSRLRLFLYQQTIFPVRLKKEGFDLLFCPSLIAPWFYPRKIITIHDAAPFILKEENSCLGKIFWQINLFFGKIFSRQIVTVSAFSRRELIDKLKIKPEKIKVIYNGSPEFKPGHPVTPLPGRYHGANYIVAVGNARSRKNLGTLLDSFAILKKDFPDLQLVIIGKRDERMIKLEEMAALTGSQNIIFTGFISDPEKEAIITGAQALVFPSLYEGFGLPLVEANVLGVPVVCSDIPAFREIASDSALFFNPQSKTDLASKVGQVLTSLSLAEDLKSDGFKNAARFRWQESALSLSELIHHYENPRNK